MMVYITAVPPGPLGRLGAFTESVVPVLGGERHPVVVHQGVTNAKWRNIILTWQDGKKGLNCLLLSRFVAAVERRHP